MIRDKRIWYPDESCSPFLVETIHNTLDARVLGFTTPQNRYGVISDFDFHGDTSFLLKSQNRIYIAEGNKPVVPAGTYQGMKTSGALLNVFENSGGNNVDGIAVALLGASRRSCRILLNPGMEYSVFVVGLVAQAMFCSISGWTFNPND